MALSNAARRAIAIRKSVARKAAPVHANDNQRRTARAQAMPKGLLAACVAAGGFDQNERFGSVSV